MLKIQHWFWLAGASHHPETRGAKVCWHNLDLTRQNLLLYCRRFTTSVNSKQANCLIQIHSSAWVDIQVCFSFYRIYPVRSCCVAGSSCIHMSSWAAKSVTSLSPLHVPLGHNTQSPARTMLPPWTSIHCLCFSFCRTHHSRGCWSMGLRHTCTPAICAIVGWSLGFPGTK